MGVTGLWTVVQPCARPIKLETLNKKRLAVDASIWIYQFLKAVRDKEGNALRNSHVVGFFRRICKLLYFGIKPVFVFDGGAPVLKRETIAKRRRRREGRREDAVRTAGKLLAVQMKRIAEEEKATARQRSRRINERERQEEVEVVPDQPVYVEETFMTEKEKRQARQFKKKDAYHLPSLEVSLEEMGAPNDPRIMSREELEEYARQFQQGEDVNLYDFSKIDFDSPFFISLPATDRYNILNAARLRSRLRMGYSKEQLETMFPDRMAFSKFQIERVKERNDLTQRLMNINGMNGDDAMYDIAAGQRIAGERNREYVLVKDSAVEGGWALGVVSNSNEGQVDKPIDVERYGQLEVFPEEEQASDDNEGFEDVPIEGLNRLPKLPFLQKGVFDESMERQVREMSERKGAGMDDDLLFVQGNTGDESLRKQENHDIDRFFHSKGDSEDEDLQLAIQMSLEFPRDTSFDDLAVNPPRTSAQAKVAAPKSLPESDDDEDFATALARSKRTKERQPPPKTHTFDGPLPFESIKIGKPSTTKESSKDYSIDADAGGFEKEPTQSKNELPLPPWFSGNHINQYFATDRFEDGSIEKYREETMTPNYQFLRDHRSPDVINPKDDHEVVDLEADSEKEPSVEVTSDMEKANDAAVHLIEDRPVPMIPTSKAQETRGALETPMKDMSGVEEVYEWNATDDEKSNADPERRVSRAEQSLSPEFEDVPIEKKNIPDIIEPVSRADPGLQAAIDADQQETFVEEDGIVTDPEDEDLIRQLAAEAEEHARFAATLNSTAHAQSAFDYEQELKQLRSQQQKDRRDADEITQVMITECQQLLGLFGLPYITAPMEAEAQCAELVSLGLVDGIVTDDSDVFLFGGTRIYKNMFNQSKFVECYLASDLEKEYALHRKKLISFAHLLGSDYTEGIPGIGPVTALEILTEFQSLEEFRDWWTEVQTGMPNSQEAHPAFYKKFRKTASKIFLPPSFPDSRVAEAYLNPEIDSDPSPFQWGVPDLNGLRNFLMATVGWSQERTDEILLPVIRDMNRRDQEGTQSNITRFFAGHQGAGAFAPRVRAGGKSRMEKAFSRLRREAASSSGNPEDGERESDSIHETRDNSVNGVGQGGRSTKRGALANAEQPDGNNDAMDGRSMSKKRKTQQRSKVT